MGKETAISWADHTFNGWWGCTPISPGCANCYAAAFDRRTGGDHFGKGKARRTFRDKHWNELLAWNEAANRDGVTRKVFCFSMGDIMDEEAPAGGLARLFQYVNQTPNLRYLFLTKRPQNYSTRLPLSFPLRNVWPGASTENQEMYDQRWPTLAALRRVPAFHGLPFWVNIGPALGPVTLRGFGEKPDWVAFEGESGNYFRHMELSWAENLLAECREFGIPFYMKQVAARTPGMGKEFIPPHLQVQEYPGAYDGPTYSAER
jgi:protein gp37